MTPREALITTLSLVVLVYAGLAGSILVILASAYGIPVTVLGVPTSVGILLWLLLH